MNEHKHSVMVVDDEENFRGIISLKLNSLGFDVIEAKNGQEALDKLETIIPEVILLDLQMPVLDGMQTLKKIKENKKLAEIKVIFLTNYGDPEAEMREFDKQVAKDLGALHYIKKSDDLEDIVKEVESVIH